MAVALDVASGREAVRWARRLRPEVLWFKVGVALVVREGPAVLRALRAEGARVFLDLKLHDIPSVVGRAARAAAEEGVDLLTVHASGGREMVAEAAREMRRGAGKRPFGLLAVTVLSSLDRARLRALGIHEALDRVVVRWARQSLAGGAHGCVASGAEAALLRRRLGPSPLLVVPGIRAAGTERDDQARILTPGAALRAGADLLVVGRPILDAVRPREVVRALQDELRRAHRDA